MSPHSASEAIILKSFTEPREVGSVKIKVEKNLQAPGIGAKTPVEPCKLCMLTADGGSWGGQKPPQDRGDSCLTSRTL